MQEEKQKILYISALAAPEVQEDIFRRSGVNPGFAMQKFNRLLAEGLAANHAEVTALSSPPVVPGSLKRCENFKNSEHGGVRYIHLPIIDFPVFRQFLISILTFFRVLSFSFGPGEKRNKSIICDILNTGITSGALLAARLCRIRTIGILTDMPGLMVGTSGLKSRLSEMGMRFLMSKYSGYVFLTESMNGPVNRHNRPYIVMEGVVDGELAITSLEEKRKDETDDNRRTGPEKIVIYAGGLFREYGIGILIDGFRKVSHPDIRLHLYGAGPMVEEIKGISEKDSRIRYMGQLPNGQIVENEKKGWLLVNPRPTDAEFVKYSFPSKNMEYMSTGTPVLTTNLPGMPDEYHDYVYILDEETPRGIARMLDELLALPPEEMREKGLKAAQFVAGKKNKIERGKEILQLTGVC
ncbi:MAG: glycosyltransferase [Muribaculaceae bacterium]|nr:glycosyltransferase [Muribaculaceae bacterium]